MIKATLKFYLFIIGDTFTLEKIIDIGLDQYYEQISEISAAASNELSIEQVRNLL